MPIFEYHCSKCDKDFEVLVLGNDKVTCPTCNGKKVKKRIDTGIVMATREYINNPKIKELLSPDLKGLLNE